jgi:hypothetical protein
VLLDFWWISFSLIFPCNVTAASCCHSTKWNDEYVSWQPDEPYSLAVCLFGSFSCSHDSGTIISYPFYIVDSFRSCLFTRNLNIIICGHVRLSMCWTLEPYERFRLPLCKFTWSAHSVTKKKWKRNLGPAAFQEKKKTWAVLCICTNRNRFSSCPTRPPSMVVRAKCCGQEFWESDSCGAVAWDDAICRIHVHLFQLLSLRGRNLIINCWWGIVFAISIMDDPDDSSVLCQLFALLTCTP